MTTGFIDPPGEFADVEEWHAFLVELEQLTPSPEVDAQIAAAKAHLQVGRRVSDLTDRDFADMVDEDDDDDDFSDLEGGEGGED